MMQSLFYSSLFLFSLIPLAAAAKPSGRFFLEGDGFLNLRSKKNGRSAKVQYRLPDGSYSEEALQKINRIYDIPPGSTERMSLRYLSLLDFLEDRFGAKRIEIHSGYRAPKYNAKLNNAAQTSLHLEGMAGDHKFVGVSSKTVKEFVQNELPGQEGLEKSCCGAGYYERGGTFHIDTGGQRHWTTATTRVGERLGASNKKVMVRTDRDIYFPGETVILHFGRITGYPIYAEATLRIVNGKERGKSFRLDGSEGKPVKIATREGRRLTWTIPEDFQPNERFQIKVLFPTKHPEMQRYPDMKHWILSNPIRILPKRRQDAPRL